MAGPSVRAADERPAPVAPVEGEIEDPAAIGSPVGITGTRGRAAATGPASGLDPPQLALPQEIDRWSRRARPTIIGARPTIIGARPTIVGARPTIVGARSRGIVGPDHRPGSPGLPPRTGLHPVRQHRAHLPQPAPPQELLGALGARHLTHPGLDGVVVPPHLFSPATLVDPRTRSGEGGGRGRPHRSRVIEHLFEHRRRYTAPPTRARGRARTWGEPADCFWWPREDGTPQSQPALSTDPSPGPSTSLSTALSTGASTDPSAGPSAGSSTGPSTQGPAR